MLREIEQVQLKNLDMAKVLEHVQNLLETVKIPNFSVEYLSVKMSSRRTALSGIQNKSNKMNEEIERCYRDAQFLLDETEMKNSMRIAVAGMFREQLYFMDEAAAKAAIQFIKDYL